MRRKNLFLLFVFRLMTMISIVTPVEAVLTGHLKYDSWNEAVILFCGAICWATGDHILSTENKERP